MSFFQKRLQRYEKKLRNTNYSVKKHQSYGILLLALLLCSSVSAKVEHYVGANAVLAEWSLVPLKSDYSPSKGVVGGLGFQYELQSGKRYSQLRFLFDVGVGATGGMTQYEGIGNIKEYLPSYDLQGDAFNYVYDIQSRHDQYTNIAVQIPLMIGVQYKRFYALAGLKVYANMVTTLSSTATISTYGQYNEWDDYRSMPEYQFFDSQPFSASVPTSLNLDINGTFEIGGRVGVLNYDVGYDVPRRKLEYRLAAFVDGGLIDIHTKSKKASVVFPKYDTNPKSPDYIYNTRTMLDNLKMNDVMSTKGFASSVKNFVFGVKFTILFQLPSQEKCVMCSDGYQSTARSYGRGGRRMKYEE